MSSSTNVSAFATSLLLMASYIPRTTSSAERTLLSLSSLIFSDVAVAVSSIALLLVFALVRIDTPSAASAAFLPLLRFTNRNDDDEVEVEEEELTTTTLLPLVRAHVVLPTARTDDRDDDDDEKEDDDVVVDRCTTTARDENNIVVFVLDIFGNVTCDVNRKVKRYKKRMTF